jgi:4-hydroxybenzoate polyprenyltransferase
MFIAFTMSAPFIFPYFITGSFQYFNFLLSLSAFFTGLSREIVKTVQDFDADLKQRKSKTLPFYIGKKNSIKLALLIFVISVFFLFFILFELIKLKVSLISYFLISISFTLCGYSIRLMFKFQDLEAIRKATLLAMAFFLVALAIAF